MALQVWLPLDGDYRNQGLIDQLVFTETGTITDIDGKIGRAKHFATGMAKAPLAYTLENELSFACWVYYDSFRSDNEWIFELGKTSSGYQNALFAVASASKTNLVFSIGGATNTSTVHGFSTATWYHLAFTWKNSEAKVYINGNLIREFTLAKGSLTSSTNLTLGCNVANSGTKLHGRLNDIRLYDHCLSYKEVKELSKGLILHYRLSKLLPNLLNGTDFNGVSKKFTLTSGSEGGFQYTPSETIIPNTEYTLSCYIRGNANINLYKICTGGNEAVTWINRNDLSTTEYKKFSLTFNSPNSNKTMNKIYICTRYGSSNSQVGDWFEILPNSLKLEQGTISTTWIPNESDTLYSAMGYDSNIELDCAPAGNQNDGTIVGTITAAADSSRYESSYHFNGTSYLKATSPFGEIRTISLWAKWDSIPSGQSVIFVDYKSYLGLGLMSSGILCSSRTSSKVFNKSNIVANTWYHFVIICPNGPTNAERKLYINGQEQTALTGTSNWSYSIDELQVGKRSSTNDGFKGKISDFRVYCTALSAEDIKELYDTAAQIDKDGNVYAYEFKEA